MDTEGGAATGGGAVTGGRDRTSRGTHRQCIDNCWRGRESLPFFLTYVHTSHSNNFNTSRSLTKTFFENRSQPTCQVRPFGNKVLVGGEALLQGRRKIQKLNFNFIELKERFYSNKSK